MAQKITKKKYKAKRSIPAYPPVGGAKDLESGTVFEVDGNDAEAMAYIAALEESDAVEPVKGRARTPEPRTPEPKTPEPKTEEKPEVQEGAD